MYTCDGSQRKALWGVDACSTEGAKPALWGVDACSTEGGGAQPALWGGSLPAFYVGIDSNPTLASINLATRNTTPPPASTQKIRDHTPLTLGQSGLSS